MAIFGKKKEEVKKEVAPTTTPAHGAPHAAMSGGTLRAARVLKQPRITEKATLASEHGAYVFNIDLRATKEDVRRAFEVVYKVTPRKINIVPVRPKKIQSRFRGLFGVKSRGKKAYVYLKEGDTIDII